MRVGMYYNNHDVRVENLPRPEIDLGEILVKVIASGICGSDVLEWYRLKKAPLVLGHEICGVIEEVGIEVKKYKAGERVFVSHHVPCNTCYYCLNNNHTACHTLHTTNYYPGGFSEFIRVPKINVERGVFVLPKNISYETGTLIEPLACVVRAQRVARLKQGHTVLILGSGVSGLLHLILGRENKAGKIIMTDIDDYHINAAKTFGADFVLNAREDLPQKLRAINNNRLADLVIVSTGALSAFKQALDCVDAGGTVLCFATTEPGIDLPVPINKFWRSGVHIMPSYGAGPADISEAIELMQAGTVNLDKLITHCLSLTDIGLGFKLVSEARESLKVIIKPHNNT